MKNFIKTVVFLGIIVAILVGLEPFFVPFFGKDTNQAATYYEIPENAIDVLVVGGSMTRVSVSPLEIYKKTGIAAYNRGSARQLPEISWLNVKEAFKKQDLKLVIINTSTLVNKTGADMDEPFIRRGMDYRKFDLDKLKIAIEFCRQSEWQNVATYVFPVLRYHDNWKKIGETYRTKQEKAAYDYMHGQYPVYKHLYMETQHLKQVDEPFQLVDRAVEYQTKIIEMCREHDCQVLLLEMPDSRWTTAKHQAVQDFADSVGVRFIDFNTGNLLEKLGITWQDDFYEGHHLNVKGSMKATRYLCDVLTNDFGLQSSDLSDELKKQFEEDYARFDKDRKTKKYKEVKE